MKGYSNLVVKNSEARGQGYVFASAREVRALTAFYELFKK